MQQQDTWHDGISYFDVGGDAKIFQHIADKVRIGGVAISFFRYAEIIVRNFKSCDCDNGCKFICR